MMATVFAFNPDEVIDAESWEEDSEVKVTREGFFLRIWLSLKRRVRRLILSGRKAFWKFWHAMPRPLRQGFVAMCAVVGFFVAYMIVYLALVLAFMVSPVLGWAATFMCIWFGLSLMYVRV